MHLIIYLDLVILVIDFLNNYKVMLDISPLLGFWGKSLNP